MIYLIDDNQNNHRENMGIDYIRDGVFADIITSVEKIEKRSLSDLSNLDFLRDADCILLHYSTEDYDFENKTFVSGSRTNAIKIIEYISQEGDEIPLVLFSNGMVDDFSFNNEDIRFVRELNKNSFYSRLYDFLEYYRANKSIELRILIYGKNFIFKEVEMLANTILNSLITIDGNNRFSVSLFQDTKVSLLRLIEISKNSYSKETIIDYLNNESLSVNEFREKINLIVESFLKYGKNIYPWL